MPAYGKGVTSRFSKSLPRLMDARKPRRQGERGIWQRRFWEHAIRDATDLDRHIDYIHWNTVRHEKVDNPREWPFSSYHKWIKEYGRPMNMPPENWNREHLGKA